VARGLSCFGHPPPEGESTLGCTLPSFPPKFTVTDYWPSKNDCFTYKVNVSLPLVPCRVTYFDLEGVDPPPCPPDNCFCTQTLNAWTNFNINHEMGHVRDYCNLVDRFNAGELIAAPPGQKGHKVSTKRTISGCAEPGEAIWAAMRRVEDSVKYQVMKDLWLVWNTWAQDYDLNHDKGDEVPCAAAECAPCPPKTKTLDVTLPPSEPCGGICCNRGVACCAGVCEDSIDFASDPNNCGQCGNVCPRGRLCVNGDCDGCAAGYTDCYGDACCAPGETCAGTLTPDRGFKAWCCPQGKFHCVARIGGYAAPTSLLCCPDGQLCHPFMGCIPA
jgi:hypothetical protein